MYSHSQNTTETEYDLMAHPVVRLGLPLVALAAGFLTLDMLGRRPLLNELTAVRHQLSEMESRLESLAGAKQQAWETNDLLTALTAQKRQLDSARAALTSMREFRRQVEAEAQQTGETVAVLDQIGQLQLRLREEGQNTEATVVAIQKLVDLKTKVLENSPGVESAQQSAAELIALKQSVESAGDVTPVQQMAEQLVALRQTLDVDVESTARAQTHADKLLTLRDAVSQSPEEIATAEQNWAAMRKLESDMVGAGKGIADAVETLELLTDLSEELRVQSQTMHGVRRSLMDIAALETTVGRVMRVLEPLAQLKNLSRMSDVEVRQAARAILDQRTKLSRREPLTESAGTSRSEVDELEVNSDRLVPPPIRPSDDLEPAAPQRVPAEEP